MTRCRRSGKSTRHKYILNTWRIKTKCYHHKIEGGPKCNILPQGDGHWAIFMNEDHIITTTSPQNCITMIREINADMAGYEEWRKYLPFNLRDWHEEDCGDE